MNISRSLLFNIKLDVQARLVRCHCKLHLMRYQSYLTKTSAKNISALLNAEYAK